MATSLMEKRAPADHSINVADRIDAFVRADRKWIVACCCIYAAVRILIFVAAFPLFNDIDEQDHYEMIYRYAHGYAPESTLPMADHVIARLATLYGSPEYYHSRETLRSVHRDVPIAVLPPALKEYHYRLVLAFWESTQEVEAQSPPVYYAVAGMWNKFGAMLGAKDWVLAYWTRSLNAIVYGIFVWISFLFVQELYPAHDFLCVAVPIFLAIFPQDVFFGVNRDVLSPLFGALALLVLFRAMREGSGVYGNLVGGGLLVGLAFVTDISNFVYAGLLGVVFYQRYCSTKTFSNSKRDLRGIAASALVAMLFPVLWMAHNTVVTGDLTASRMKTAYLGWTLKAWPEIWHHPILSVSGFHYFFNELTAEFWRGEIWWRGVQMHWHVTDGVYRISSIVLIGIFVRKLFTGEGSEERLQRVNAFLCLCLIVVSYLFMAAISLPYDFHDCVNPTREHPFFVSGRIIIGILLPFAIVYLSGFEILFRPIRRYIHPFVALMVFAVFVTISEFVIRRDIFHSNFNFFSLLRM